MKESTLLHYRILVLNIKFTPGVYKYILCTKLNVFTVQTMYFQLHKRKKMAVNWIVQKILNVLFENVSYIFDGIATTNYKSPYRTVNIWGVKKW